jgi:gluconokinase
MFEKLMLPKTLIVMGVSGCGKSSVGAELARVLGGVFEDADGFHSSANLQKMRDRTPLTDEDRWPWLEALRAQIVSQRSRTDCYVLACSALKQRYRDVLRGDDSPEQLVFVYLKGSKALIQQRVEQRNLEGQHFMPPELLDSQFAAIEAPKDAIVVNVALGIDEIVGALIEKLR